MSGSMIADEAAGPDWQDDADGILLIAESHRAALRRFFRRRAPDLAMDSDDLVQEVFLRLARRREKGGIEHPNRYIFQTASHVLIDLRRRRLARREDDHSEFKEFHVVDEVSSPERVVVSKQEIEIVIAALEELPRNVRAAFLLHRFENMTYREISVHLGVSVSSVEKYLIRALSFLAERLQSGR